MNADLNSLDGLVSPYGVVSQTYNPGTYAKLPMRFATAHAGSGRARYSPGKRGRIAGSGDSWESQAHARFVAIAEAAERYAGMDNLREHRIWASADELAGEFLDPERYPRCSQSERSVPGCRFTEFDPAARIRWVRGLELTTSEYIWLPAVMATYGLASKVPAEDFNNILSTGYAVHTDPAEAVVRGICEVIERDSNAILWLQRLPVPRLDSANISTTAAELIDWLRERFVDVHLFDATSDLGIPTVYCLLTADHDSRMSRCVTASTSRTLAFAAEKALREALASREYLAHSDRDPSSPEDFGPAEDGALYMGWRERSHAFDFLLQDSREHRAPDCKTLPEESGEALSALVETFAESDIPVVAVDRTPTELHDAGLTAVNIVIPDLQPMSLEPQVQFKAHPRLYAAPARMGYRVLPEQELNPWPQPFP